MSISDNFTKIRTSIPDAVTLCAVSKFQPKSSIEELYSIGHRVFGESRPQELDDKARGLPVDIEWHFIGHLQSNKVALILPFVSLIESVDSQKLIDTISKEAHKIGKTVKILLQMHIAKEQSKQGFSGEEITAILDSAPPQNIEIVGLMAMATYTNDMEQVKEEFLMLKNIFDKYPQLNTLSTGMSGDYGVAIECGSTNVRIGSSIFGDR